MSKIDITIRDKREVHIITSMVSYAFDLVIKRYFDLHSFFDHKSKICSFSLVNFVGVCYSKVGTVWAPIRISKIHIVGGSLLSNAIPTWNRSYHGSPAFAPAYLPAASIGAIYPQCRCAFPTTMPQRPDLRASGA